MKKLIAMMLVLIMVAAFVGCAAEKPKDETKDPSQTPSASDPSDPPAPADGTMTYDDYMAAAIDAKVTVEVYVQATQAWWDNKITVYAQDADTNGFFIYEMACSQEDAVKLVPGAKIRVTGTKGEWSGEIEIMDATFELIDDAEPVITEAIDLTDKLGTDELVKYQNVKATFKGMTVVSVTYKNDEPGDDIYVKLSKGDAEYDFCVERDLTDPETEVYKAVGALKAGDVVDIEGFLYWYEGPNTHITAISAAQ